MSVNPIEQATSIVYDWGTARAGPNAADIVDALDRAGLLRSDAEQAVIAAAERWASAPSSAGPGGHLDALSQLWSAVAALRAARKETP